MLVIRNAFLIDCVCKQGAIEQLLTQLGRAQLPAVGSGHKNARELELQLLKGIDARERKVRGKTLWPVGCDYGRPR